MLKGVPDELGARGIIKDGEVGLHALCDEDDPKLLKDPGQGFTGKFVDGMSGQVLNDSLVAEARRKELEYFTSKGVWRKRLLSEAFAKTGRRPISVRWVDVNKGDQQEYDIICRLVAREMGGA